MKVLSPHPPAPSASPCDHLSDRQRECLDLAALGLTSARIGDRLGLSPRTVDEHLMTACRVLGVRTRIQAVARLAAVQRPLEPRTLQMSALAFCQTFQGPAVRSRLGPCVNPLLSQPVVEAGLALSAVDLTWGGRDRAAARAAFADVLPPSILDRRSKGELGAYYGGAVAAHLDFLRDYLLGGALAEAGLIDPGLEDRLTRDALLWRGGHSHLLSLALTEAWVRRWRERLDRRVP